MADTILIRNENVRRPLEPLKQNVLATGRRPSCSDLDVDKSEARRFKLVLQEKDKQLVFLEQQLLITQSRVEELQVGSDKHKRQEREAKKTLSSKESHLRRQTVALKHTNDKLQCYVLKEDDKIRRSKMERKELQEELERMEDEYTDQQVRNNADNKALEDIIISMRDENTIALGNQADEFNSKTVEMAEQFAVNLSSFSAAVMQLKDQASCLLSENSQLHSQVGMLSADAATAMVIRESHLKNISFLETINKDSNTEFMYQNVELVRMTLRNAFLQNLVEELSIEKQTLKSEKDDLLADYEIQSHERIYKLNQENIDRRDQLICSVAEVARLSEEADLQTNSVTELWKSFRAVQLSERNLRVELDQARKLLSVAHNEINTKIFSLKVLGEVKGLLEADMAASAERIAQLVSTQQLVEENLRSTHADLLTTTEQYDTTKHLLLVEKETVNVLTLELKKNSLAFQEMADDHVNVMQSQNCVIDSLKENLSKRDEEIVALNIQLSDFGVDLKSKSDSINAMQLQRDDDKKFLGALKLRLKETKVLLDESKNKNESMSLQFVSLEEKMICSIEDINVVNKENINNISTIDQMKAESIKQSNNHIESALKINELEETVRTLETLVDEKSQKLDSSKKREEALKDQVDMNRNILSAAIEEHSQSMKENHASYSLLSNTNEILTATVLEGSNKISVINATLIEYETLLTELRKTENDRQIVISSQTVDVKMKELQIKSLTESSFEVSATLEKNIQINCDLKSEVLRLSGEAILREERFVGTLSGKDRREKELMDENKILNEKVEEQKDQILSSNKNLDILKISQKKEMAEIITRNEERKNMQINIETLESKIVQFDKNDSNSVRTNKISLGKFV